MKKTIGALGWPVFIMAILSLGGLIYNFIFYEGLRPLILGFGDYNHYLVALLCIFSSAFILGQYIVLF
jgi:hypothetical protein